MEIFLSVLLCTSLTINLYNCAKYDKNDITETLQSALDCHSNPAMAVAVVQDNKIVFSRGFGTTLSDGKGDNVTDNTLFGVASISKSFAATLIVKLLDETGRYSLNTPLRKVFKNNHIFKSHLQSNYATIRDLLSHRIGLPSNNKIRLDTTLTRANLIQRIRHLSIKGRFRDSYYYSNLMYGLLTYLAEKLGGATWEELVSKHLYQPLGMKSSTFTTIADPDDLDIARGYVDDYGMLQPVPWEISKRWGMLCGSGCVLTNAKDMSQWMMFHLRNGQTSTGKTLVNSSSMNVLHSPQLRLQKSLNDYFQKPKVPASWSFTTYAMGFRNGYYRGYEILAHSGSTFGYRALMTLIPAANLGIFTALTGDDPELLFRTSLHNYLADIFLDEEPWLNKTTLCTFPEPFYKPVAKKTRPNIEKFRSLARDASDYAGVYFHPAYKTLKIIPKFPLEMQYGYAKFKLYAKTTKDHFYIDSYGITVNMIFGTVKFHTKSSDKTVIDAIEVTAFQTNDPPIFTKVSETSGQNPVSAAGTYKLTISFVILLHIFIYPIIIFEI